MKKVKTIADLKIGDKAVIAALDMDEISLRLMEMGCVPGSPIEVYSKAALGGPMCVSVSGYHLSLRLDEASKIILD